MICSACKSDKPSEDFNSRNRKCRACRYAVIKAWKKANYSQVLASNRAWRHENRPLRLEQERRWRAKHRDEHYGKIREWHQRNPDKRRRAALAYAKRHPERVNARNQEYAAKRLGAVPSWANKFFMQEAYALAKLRTKLLGSRWVVDHIVPLRSKIVCGLHTHNNLRVISAKENASKGNRYWPDMPEVIYGN